MYGGTLPSAEIYRYDEESVWTKIAQVDATPDVKYRRAWSMAVHQGRLFAGTLPSGRVCSFEAGKNATFDKPFPGGWHHVAAVRDDDRLRLFLDAQEVSRSTVMNGRQLNLSGSNHLRIGFGAQDYFEGDIADLRIYNGPLTPGELQGIAREVSMVP
ncbi:MAG: LamG-like jellyroll fold domain-containing protein, partial [Planctomycetota bacterium]